MRSNEWSPGRRSPRPRGRQQRQRPNGATRCAAATVTMRSVAKPRQRSLCSLVLASGSRRFQVPIRRRKRREVEHRPKRLKDAPSLRPITAWNEIQSREAIPSDLRQGSLISRPGLETLHPTLDVRIAVYAEPCAGELTDKTQLDVGGRKRFAQ